MFQRKTIEDELKAIEKETKGIEKEEMRIEEKEDLIRIFEELGLMRWKSYYILTAGAILLLALTFVTALWVMQDELIGIQTAIDQIDYKLDQVTLSPEKPAIEPSINDLPALPPIPPDVTE